MPCTCHDFQLFSRDLFLVAQMIRQGYIQTSIWLCGTAPTMSMLQHQCPRYIFPTVRIMSQKHQYLHCYPYNKLRNLRIVTKCISVYYSGSLVLGPYQVIYVVKESELSKMSRWVESRIWLHKCIELMDHNHCAHFQWHFSKILSKIPK